MLKSWGPNVFDRESCFNQSLRRTVDYLRLKQHETLAVDAVERKLILGNTYD